MQLYYLGPKGTFSYLACRQYFSENEATFQPKSNLFEVIKAVADDDTSIGVVPIENSIEGTINIVADALAQQDVFAHGEIRLDINFALYGNGTDSISDIK
ncbi:prephenate dehydratase domain-containing protein, partial [Staphylococcus aureus]